MNKLNEVFNVPEILHSTIDSDMMVIYHDTNIERNVDVDYEKTRQNLHILLEQGQDALMCALEVAKSSEHPRAFEVVGALMKQLSDINHQLLDLSDKRQKMDKKKEEPPPANVTNNAIFVGSTDALNKMIQGIAMSPLEVK